MRKILITLVSVFTFMASAQAIEVMNRAIGLNVSLNSIDTNLKDDVDSNGTTDTTKDISNDIGVASIFGEVSIGNGGAGMLTIGVDYIPVDAEFDSRSTTQSSLKAASDGAASSGTNSGNVEVSDHTTFYLRPTVMINDSTAVFATYGIISADAESQLKSVSSTDKTITQTIDGEKMGIGIRKVRGGGFVQVELSETDYDAISATTSNSTRVTADIDTQAVTISFGKSF